MSFPTEIAGFRVLLLSYRPSTLHALYLREHITKKQAEEHPPAFPPGRTLFIVNIPPDATDSELSLFFQPCGIVERVVFDRDPWMSDTFGPVEEEEQEDDGGDGGSEDGADVENGEEGVQDIGYDSDQSTQPRKKRKLSKNKTPQVTPLPVPDTPLRTYHHSGSTAHVIFLEQFSLERALSLASSGKPRPWPSTGAAAAPRGLAHYASKYKALRPSLSDIKAHADTYMQVYDYNKALAKQKSEYRKGEAIVDEDGFTLVTRGGAYGTTLGGGVGVANKMFVKNFKDGIMETSGRRGNKKSKKYEKERFYKFQRHEEQRRQLEDLKKNWEKDKEAVAQLSKARLNPY